MLREHHFSMGLAGFTQSKLKVNKVNPGSHVWSKSKRNTPLVHTREIVKQEQAQEQEKGEISFSLFLRLLHTCEPGFARLFR